MCAIFQVSGNCLSMVMQLISSIILFKRNCKTKIHMLGDITSIELVTSWTTHFHLLNSIRISHCETKTYDNYFPGLSLGTFNGSLSILYTHAKN